MTFTSRRSVLFLVFFVALAATITALHAGTIDADAHIGEFDDFLQKKAENARQASLRAYNPDPEAVTDSFNEQVGE